MRSSATAPRQLHARRTIDSQAKKVAGLAEVGVPVGVCEEVEESQKVEQEDCEQNEEEGSVGLSAT